MAVGARSTECVVIGLKPVNLENRRLITAQGYGDAAVTHLTRAAAHIATM
jgi:hypothetical protein